MKIFARAILTFLARRILRTYRPLVIAVAGSVGKTSVKDAIAVSLGTEGVRQTESNFNSVVGVAVTIIAGGLVRQSLVQWLTVIGQGIGLLIRHRPYPLTLVLEYGSDKPGDVAELVVLAQPSIGVLTAIAPEHLEFFHTLAGVEEEEWSLIGSLPPNGLAVLNLDDQRVRQRKNTAQARVVSYGLAEQADVRAQLMTYSLNDRGLPTGMMMKVAIEGSVIPVAIPGVIGKHQLYPYLAALAVALGRGQDLHQAVQRLRHYQAPAGRMRLFDGVSGSLLIDDTYNASPLAMQEAIATLLEIRHPGKKHIIVGQMSELGASSATWHDQVGATLPPTLLETVITVGPLAERIGRAAIKNGFPPEHVSNVASAEAAAALLQGRLNAGDVVLLKGSRFASRLEKAVAMLLAHPDQDTSKLVQGHDG